MMTPEQTTRRYFKLWIPSVIGYAAAILGTTWVEDHMNSPAFALYALAGVAIVALLVIFWGHWRYINETDEFLRTIQIKGVLFGTACVMVVATGWGTLETLADAPKLQVFLLMPIFWVSYSAAVVVLTKREGGVF